jgi:serine protease Do
VSEVESDGPAAKGGLKAGDVITKFDGKSIESVEDFRRAVGDASGGAEVAVAVQRDGRPLDLKVRLRAGDTVLRERRPTI